MTPETRAAVGRVIDQAGRLAELRDTWPLDADHYDRAATTYGQAAAIAADVDLCDVASSLAPEWAGNDIRTDRAGYAARLAAVILP